LASAFRGSHSNTVFSIYGMPRHAEPHCGTFRHESVADGHNASPVVDCYRQTPKLLPISSG
jgi:hypothetical protein